jgi:hypothetical protein
VVVERGRARFVANTSVLYVAFLDGESARHYQCQGGTISATPFLGPPLLI